MVCPPVRGDNPRALASGIFPEQADKPLYNDFIPPSSVYPLLCVKYVILMVAPSGEGVIMYNKPSLLRLLCIAQANYNMTRLFDLFLWFCGS